jgi:hypothetical protein
MVKFSKQLDMQLVPEWRGAYCQYKLLKKDLKLITFNWHLMPECPVAPSNPPFTLTRRKSPWSSVDVIKVKSLFIVKLLSEYSCELSQNCIQFGLFFAGVKQNTAHLSTLSVS